MRAFKRTILRGVIAALAFCPRASIAQSQAARHFHDDVQPILSEFCYTCHGDGLDKGKVAFDELKTDEALLDKDLWLRAMKNLRAGLMPPKDEPRPSAEQIKKIEAWIKRDVFKIDPANPDPGRVTLRRLNRVEYANTIRDLMGVEFKVDDEFPPDDTGYGFDNIGDVLTVSPMLLEKYMQAAETVTAQAVPATRKLPAETMLATSAFRGQGATAEKMSFYKPATVSGTAKIEQSGEYKLIVEFTVNGSFDFDAGKCRILFSADDQQLLNETYGWQDRKKYHYEYTEKWEPGDHKLAFELQPLNKPEDQVNTIDARVVGVTIQGPMDEARWVSSKNYSHFFTQSEPPQDAGERLAYAKELLKKFATRAYRRPVDDRTVDRLAMLAEKVYSQPDKSFEQGISQAFVAVLSSPRFIFRVEDSAPGTANQAFGDIDEYALASRLSYFLWSTMPDDELTALAARGELRKNLDAQVKRMLADRRSDALVQNFTGQWLEARDVEGISIDERSILARDAGNEKELKKQEEEFRAKLAALAKQQTSPQALANGQVAGVPRPRPPALSKPAVQLTGEIRTAMRRETEMYFGYVLHENRSVLELIDSNYTFLNGALAKFYGIPDVTGPQMRRVELPPDSPRGGVLTQGTVLVVTSNPTRTSPVKRGLFILDNILGTPAPPPPPEVPPFEQAEKQFGDHDPTMREVMQIHREKPLCAACHTRMDGLGLALENFNAMGMWREKERGQTIDASGELVTGEQLKGIHDLKQVLKNERRMDFYRCLTEKMLTYALGRGPEYYDVQTIDQIVDRLEAQHGQIQELLTGVIHSPQFQERRNVPMPVASRTEVQP